MKSNLAAIAIFSTTFISMTCVSGPNLVAQSRGAQHTQVVMASAGRTDLNSALIDLDRVSQATQSDIANLHVEKWKSGWKSGFLKDGSHKNQAQQAAGSLQRNLANALPGLMHDVQNSRGSLSATFKLYDDVSLVCEAVDSLISASEAAGKKSDAAPLVDDFSALARIRRSLAGYIQQSASSLETKGKMPYTAFSAPTAQPQQMTSSSAPQVITDNQGVKKIIIDDTVPEKKQAPAARKKPTTLSNLE
ncbi:MAG: hypothetical protein LAO78_27885 [Acidobacteriia bacterium]|nr:hypothetical protein [Terriglobia bacterium]